MNTKILGVQQYFRVSNPKILWAHAVLRPEILRVRAVSRSIEPWNTPNTRSTWSNLSPILVTLLQGTRSIYCNFPEWYLASIVWFIVIGSRIVVLNLSKAMPKRTNTWYNGTPCSQNTLRANPLSTFTFRPVPQGKTDNWSFFHKASPTIPRI